MVNNLRKPDWLKIKIQFPEEGKNIEKYLEKEGINTVCHSAKCPNRNQCFSKGIATFMILGDVCTRNCAFCAVISGTPEKPDKNEPRKIVNTIKKFNIKHAVITSVTRDDLPDEGAGQFASVLKLINKETQNTTTEILIPDFHNKTELIKLVTDENPQVFNHNLETIPRLYKKIRPQADYNRSLNVLKKGKELNPKMKIKSGIMVGLGESLNEVKEVLKDLKSADCDIVTIGQYLRPSNANVPVEKYVTPQEFEEIKNAGEEVGIEFMHVGPFVRSSYNAEELYRLGSSDNDA